MSFSCTGRPQSLKVLIGTTELPPVGEPDRLVRAYSLKRDELVAIATAKPEAATPAAANASDASAVPEAFRGAPPIYDPAADRRDTAGPASDSDRRPQP